MLIFKYLEHIRKTVTYIFTPKSRAAYGTRFTVAPTSPSPLPLRSGAAPQLGYWFLYQP